MRVTLATIAVAFLVVVSGYSTAFGCTCEIHPHRSDFRKATAVFIGTVMEITNPTPPEDIRDMGPQFTHFVQLDIEKRYKGAKKETEEIWSYEIPYSCGGFEFKKGEKYLLYIYRAEQGSRYATTACTRSRAIALGGDLLNEQLSDLNLWTFRFWSRIWPF